MASWVVSIGALLIFAGFLVWKLWLAKKFKNPGFGEVSGPSGPVDPSTVDLTKKP